ncbi:ABC transporter permease [Nocardioides sp. BYT-33-1]|uniref:ABC transporter permease n=1 Tax=Nocardioides sp. BYT-33-1 TaxID=3416952 RepID=UPI003F534615
MNTTLIDPAAPGTGEPDVLRRSPVTAALRMITRRGLAAWILVLLLVIALSVRDGSRFWSSASLASVLTATVVLGLVALGQHVVVLTGGIDLSVGSVATLGALLTAVLIDGYPVRTVPVILAVLAIGALIGAVHGVLVGKVGLAAFIVTLATFYAVQGLALVVSSVPTGQVTVALSDFAIGRVGPVPYLFVVLVVAVALVALLLNRTVLGRHILAVGGDREGARANGIRVVRTTVAAYAVSGLLAAGAGVLLAARATIGSPTAGQGLELSAIAAVVIGGVSLLGGRGTLVGTMGGVALLTLVSSSITIWQLTPTLTDLVRGAIIVAAAALFVSRERR